MLGPSPKQMQGLMRPCMNDCSKFPWHEMEYLVMPWLSIKSCQKTRDQRTNLSKTRKTISIKKSNFRWLGLAKCKISFLKMEIVKYKRSLLLFKIRDNLVLKRLLNNRWTVTWKIIKNNQILSLSNTEGILSKGFVKLWPPKC